MKFRLRRLRARHLRAIITLSINFLLAWQRLVPPSNLRPRDIVLPVVLAQMIVMIIATQFQPATAFTIGIVGNLLIVGVAILPAVRNQKGGI